MHRRRRWKEYDTPARRCPVIDSHDFRELTRRDGGDTIFSTGSASPAVPLCTGIRLDIYGVRMERSCSVSILVVIKCFSPAAVYEYLFVLLKQHRRYVYS